MSDRVNVPVKCITFFNRFNPDFQIDDIIELHQDLFEFKGRLMDWTLGRTCYIWLSSEAQMMANCANEMNDGGKPPRYSSHEPDRKVIAVGRRVLDWERRSVVGKFDVEETRATSMFSMGPNTGLVPDLRQWCIDQMTMKVNPMDDDQWTEERINA